MESEYVNLLNEQVATMGEALRAVRKFYQDNFEIMPVAFQTIDDICAAAMGDEA